MQQRGHFASGMICNIGVGYQCVNHVPIFTKTVALVDPAIQSDYNPAYGLLEKDGEATGEVMD